MPESGIYNKTAEPGIFRSNAGGATAHPGNKDIHNPLIAATWHIYEWKSAYDVNTTNVWTETAVGSGTGLAVQDARGGKAKFTNGATDNDTYSYAAKYEICKVSAGKDTSFATTIEVKDVDKADLFVGLAAKLGSGNLFDNRVDSIGFYLVGATGASLYAECNKDGTATQTDTGVDVADATELAIGFRIVSNVKVIFFAGTTLLRPTYVTTMTTNIPDNEELAVHFGLRNYGGVSGGNALTLSSIKIFMDL